MCSSVRYLLSLLLEVLGQLHWLYPNAEAFYRGELERMVDALRPRPPA